MPDEPQWPTEDDDTESSGASSAATVQVSRTSVDQPTMRLPVAAVLSAPSTQEPPRSSPVRGKSEGGAAESGARNGEPGFRNGSEKRSGGLSGEKTGGKSHGPVAPEAGQPRAESGNAAESGNRTVELNTPEPPRATPVRVQGGRRQPAAVVEPEGDRTRVVRQTDVANAKTARVDQLPMGGEQSWFEQPKQDLPRPDQRPEPRQQPPRPDQQQRREQGAAATMRVDQLQRQDQPRSDQQRPPQQRPEPQQHEDLPVTGYDQEPEDRLSAEEPKKNRKPLLVGLAVLVVAALAGATLYAVARLDGSAAIETRPPAAPAAVQPLVKEATAGAPAPTAAGVRQALAGPLGNAALGTLTGSVVDPANGTPLWQAGDTTPATPASSLKILTAAAALLSLDKTAQLSTKVVQGAEPGTVVIVGGGDPTISGVPGRSVYPGAATLDDLVNQVKQKGPVTKVEFDLSRYTGEALGPQWEQADIAGGSVAPIVPFMLDGGRVDQANINGARTGSPGQAAADAFAQRLGAPAATAGTAPAGAQVLGEIKSAPVEQLVDNMMQISDNVLTEAIAREIAIKTGNEPSFAGGVKAVRDVLGKHGFDLTGASFVDGSGLSASNKIPAKLLTDVLAVAAEPTLDDQRTAMLRPLLTSLPVAGGSGTLAGRYTGAAAQGKGWVRAKTGTLTAVNALAGVVVDVDGRVLVFAFMSGSDRNPETEVRPALDALAAALRGCGCS
ncbi:D-alanyl-D-alanine carboxypeptidase / D-alanyl-D-alanine-endopeptidase (penicillin-binding protein 4) [Lentzea fradiae]|uniref:D-alanyl-D-alanine carboxypeptidase / D-alanyl-D-alanine-endopeptidase (Penicillin-binding protein 4) n=1 Tax=Lentzea fradiae TaxID=200378 RepID=A0A1G8APJ1_9PSEU|nr:D-alanyl-D-alanine carboxypeptidase / D-alanyl-D-alanine-endopeptidase (penicillin-binding protein 4) [Lentzea fradiae]